MQFAFIFIILLKNMLFLPKKKKKLLIFLPNEHCTDTRFTFVLRFGFHISGEKLMCRRTRFQNQKITKKKYNVILQLFNKYTV